MDLAALDFTGKTVWVTGASQGIGQAVAAAFTGRGAYVIGFDKRFAGTHVEALGQSLELDLAKRADVDKVVGSVLANRPRVDVLVHAAGIMRVGNVETLTYADWQELFDVNVSGLFYILKHTVPLFKAQQAGAVVTIGSNAAHTPRTQMAGYGAAKAALTSLTQSVALDLAPFGVRCNTISPGSTDTPMLRAMWQTRDDAAQVIAGTPEQYRLGIPLGKLATAVDIANLAVFLASDLAGHIVMQDMVVDGGATLGA